MKNLLLKGTSVSLFFCLLFASIISIGQPTITSFTPASGPVGTLVTINGTNLSSPTAFTIAGVSAIAVSDNGTTMVGMVMPGAATRAISIKTAAGTVTSSSSFSVTVAQPPQAQQGSKLVGTGATGTARQGRVSLSADGNTALVGGYNDNTAVGATWVYTRSDSVWTQQGTKLVGTGAIGASLQGGTLCLSADGNTAIVGGDQDNAGAGAAWIFTRSGGVWSQQGSKLVGTGAINGVTGALQGSSVSLSADGNTAVVGAAYDSTYQGAAWVYTRSGGVWTQQGGKLVGTGATGNAQPEQGTGICLSADGNTFIIGGANDNAAAGAAWIFTRSGGVWTQQGGKLVGSGAVGNAYQGGSVSLSADGNTAIVGGFKDNSFKGAAWVYTRSGDVWTQQGSKLVGTGVIGNNAYQGESVSLSADGNTAIVGGIFDNGGVGAAWVYTRSGGVWTQQNSKLVGTGATGDAQQGYSVSLSADGITALVGGLIDNAGAGAAWVFKSPQPPTVTSFTPASGPVGTLVTINGTDLSSPTALSIAGVSAIAVSSKGATMVGMVMPGAVTGAISVTTATGSITSSGSFTVTAGQPPSAQQGTKLVGTGATGAAGQGYSVAVSADGNTAIVGGYNDNSDTGAVWIYTRTGSMWTQQGNKLVGTGAIGTPDQGFSVSISADGNTAIVGGDADNYGAGAAWVYIRSGSVWTQQGGKLVGTGATGAISSTQGYSVSISADGNTAIVGGAYDNLTAGAAWIFTRSAGVWTQQGSKLVGTGGTDEALQGYSVSLSADGNTAMVGGNQDNNYAGAAWIYTRSAGVWTQQGGKLVGTGATDDAQQGYSVSLSADGNTAMLGGSADNNGAGAAWVFTRSGGVWTQQGIKLVGTGATGDAGQGYSVSLSADGNTATVGGSTDNTNAGVAWVYTRSGGIWTQQGGKLVGTGGTGDAGQGTSVSLSADGSTALVGGPGDNSTAGAAWVFVSLPPPPATGLNFDGIDDRVQLPSPLVGNLTNFTAEAWVKWDGVNNGIIYSEGKTGDNNPVFSFGPTQTPTKGAVEIILRNTGAVGLDKQLTNAIIPVNVWTHVAFVRTSVTTAILYINGNPTDSMTFADPGTVALDVANIGVHQGSGFDGYFGGSIDELQLWNRVLCQGEIQNNMNAGINATAQSGLVAAYHLDNGFVGANNAGLTTASDATGKGNDGTLVNFALTGTKSNWAAGKVTGTAPTYIPSSLSAPAAGTAVSQTEIINAAGTYYTDNTCGLIAKVVPSGDAPVSGSITVKVTIDTSVQEYNNRPYVQRHYDIVPATNSANATATVTLYFTQADIDAYNAVRGDLPALPTRPSDATGIANLRITQFHGFGIAPGNYTGAAVLIDPDDANIIWNPANSRWEVTFDVTGFSGFYVFTTLGNGALPVTLLNFSGTNYGTINNLKWTTTAEQNSAFFELERSTDGNNFIKTATIAAQGNSSSNISYSYNDDIAGISGAVYFYRLKMVDIDGHFIYSSIIKINTLGNAFSMEASPNPFSRNLQVNISSPLQQQATISLTDINGRLLFKINYLIQQGSNVLTLPQADNLPKGMYLLRLQTATQQQNRKVIKQ